MGRRRRYNLCSIPAADDGEAAQQRRGIGILDANVSRHRNVAVRLRVTEQIAHPAKAKLVNDRRAENVVSPTAT